MWPNRKVVNFKLRNRITNIGVLFYFWRNYPTPHHQCEMWRDWYMQNDIGCQLSIVILLRCHLITCQS